MKRLVFIPVLLVLLYGALGTANAGNLGVGVMLGEPSGFKVKLWLNETRALDFGLGWGYDRYRYDYDYYYTDTRCYNGDFYSDNVGYCQDCRRYYYGNYWRRTNLSISYLYHNFSLIRSRENLALYYGPGISLNTWYGEGWQLGVRGVAGIAWMHRSGLFDVFLELTPVLQVAPGAWLEMYGGLGTRYYF